LRENIDRLGTKIKENRANLRLVNTEVSGVNAKIKANEAKTRRNPTLAQNLKKELGAAKARRARLVKAIVAYEASVAALAILEAEASEAAIEAPSQEVVPEVSSELDTPIEADESDADSRQRTYPAEWRDTTGETPPVEAPPPESRSPHWPAVTEPVTDPSTRPLITPEVIDRMDAERVTTVIPRVAAYEPSPPEVRDPEPAPEVESPAADTPPPVLPRSDIRRDSPAFKGRAKKSAEGAPRSGGSITRKLVAALAACVVLTFVLVGITGHSGGSGGSLDSVGGFGVTKPVSWVPPTVSRWDPAIAQAIAAVDGKGSNKACGRASVFGTASPAGNFSRVISFEMIISSAGNPLYKEAADKGNAKGLVPITNSSAGILVHKLGDSGADRDKPAENLKLAVCQLDRAAVRSAVDAGVNTLDPKALRNWLASYKSRPTVLLGMMVDRLYAGNIYRSYFHGLFQQMWGDWGKAPGNAVSAYLRLPDTKARIAQASK
jgi:hypothetical protein